MLDKMRVRVVFGVCTAGAFTGCVDNVKSEKIVAATCAYTRAIDRSLRAGYRSILVLTSLANTRAGQSERRLRPAPLRTPEW